MVSVTFLFYGLHARWGEEKGKQFHLSLFTPLYSSCLLVLQRILHNGHNIYILWYFIWWELITLHISLIIITWTWFKTRLRDVLGNKCAGRHNFKTAYFKETTASGYFLTLSSPIWVFFCSALPQDDGGELSCSYGRGRPQLFLKVSCTAKTKYRNFETNIPRKEISGSQSQFPHSCVTERFIYSHHCSPYSSGGNM